jgi:glucose/arabinose dehydrogenase
MNLFFTRKSVFSFFVLLIFLNANAQPVINYNTVITSLSSPVDIVNAGDGTNRIFVVEQGSGGSAAIKVYSSTYALLGTFLTVTGISTGGEQGLLSLAFHPNYETNGFFWVYYTNGAGDLEVSRYKVSAGNANVADASSKQIVITIAHPGESNHNGAKLNFGSDGYLYFATGDGGGGGDPNNNAQNGNSLLGKMLRINVSTGTTAPFYTVPNDNPFVTNAGILDEIWALGLRNPFRWSFDRANGNMWIGDVGQGQREEVNFITAAKSDSANYGWRCYEGKLTFNTNGCQTQNNYVFPVFDYQNLQGSNTPASVVGGYVYRGTAYPSMQGFYYCTDVYTGKLYKININTFDSTAQSGLPNLVAGFGETEAGELLAVSLNGNAYALVPNIPTSVNNLNNEKQPRIYPTVVTNRRITLELPLSFTQLQIINMNGVVLLQQNIAGRMGSFEMPLQQMPAGVYVVKLMGDRKAWLKKIIVH